MIQVSTYEKRPDSQPFTTIDDLILLSQELFTRLRQISQYKYPLSGRRGVKRMEKNSKTESRYRGDDEKRERRTVVVFQESAKEFIQAISELSARLG
jgi:hypothetical protein